MKVVTVVGARPQFIKTKIVSEEFKLAGINEILLHTGQHFDFQMSEVFFEELNLREPDYNLNINSGLHGKQTGNMLVEIEQVLIKEKPELVLVYGDTNSTLAGALAAAKLHIPVAHIEAGLRSYNREMPEEINRVLTDNISTLLFSPSEKSVANLKTEGITSGVHVVGDVMYDVILKVKQTINAEEVLRKYGLTEKMFILCTIHRAENSDNEANLREIVQGLNDVANTGIKIIFPIHPRTVNALRAAQLYKKFSDNIIITEPVSYSNMIVLEENAKLIITDSGGVQKEGYYLNTPCVIPRYETEWVELVEQQCSHLTGADANKIFGICGKIYRDSVNYEPIKNIYGDGTASNKIVGIIKKFMGE